MKVGVIGGGPSGLAIARMLSDRGYEVYVYEAHRSFAVKPCGWGYPTLDSDEKKYEVFSEAVKASLWVFKGYNVYLNDDLLFHSDKQILGYIIDKRQFLESLSQGVEVERGSPARYLGGGLIRGRSGVKRFDIVIIAGGFPAQPRRLDRILAVQAIIRSPRIEDAEIPELRFYSDLVGYAWVFPEGEKTARVGVGGYASRETLEKILGMVIKKRQDLAKGEVVKIEGAEVTVSGVDWDLARSRDPFYVGEALGYTMPVTGEGIRPAIWSSIALFNAIEKGSSYEEELRKLRLTRFIGIHRKILDIMLKMKPSERDLFIKNVPEDLMLNLSLGRAGTLDLLRLAKIPELAMILAKYSIKII